MSNLRKIRSDSIFAQLGTENQKLVVSWLKNPEYALADVQDKLKNELGVVVTIAAISVWRRRYGFLDQYASSSELLDEIMKGMQGNPNYSGAALKALEQQFFELSLTPDSNPELMVLIAKILGDSNKYNLQRARLNLDVDKFRRETAALFLQFYQDAQAKEIAASNDGKDVKVEKLVELFWGKKPENLLYS